MVDLSKPSMFANIWSSSPRFANTHRSYSGMMPKHKTMALLNKQRLIKKDVVLLFIEKRETERRFSGVFPVS